MDQGSPWGMVLQSGSEWDVNELYKARVAFLRIDFPWSVLQPNNSSEPFAWLYFDRLVRYAVDRGMWVLGGLYGTPKWAVDVNRMNADGNRYRPLAYPPAELSLWEDYVRKVVTRYSARGVRYWGIWNEPDSRDESDPEVVFWRGTPEEFRTGVFDTAMKVFRERPDLRVCVPDLAKSTDPGPWLHPILQRAGRNIFAVTAHVYYGSGDGSDVVGRAAITRRIVDSYNASNGTQIQLWITETGWHSEQHSEGAIAEKMRDLVREVRRNPWVRKVFPYVWVDDTHRSSFKSSERSLRVRWYGYSSEIALLEPPPPPVPLERDSLLLSHNVPQQLTRGQTYNIQMRFRNIGRWEWTKLKRFSLGFGARPTWGALVPGQTITEAGLGQLLFVLQSPQPSTIAQPRVELPAAVVVPKGGEVTFSFPLTAPSSGVAAGVWMGWGMVHEPARDPDNVQDSMFFGQGLLQWVQIA